MIRVRVRGFEVGLNGDEAVGGFGVRVFGGLEWEKGFGDESGTCAEGEEGVHAGDACRVFA